MKRHFFGAVGALAVVALLAGCKSDPTASLRGGVDRVVISRTYVELNVGQTIRVNAKSYDEQGNVLNELPDVTVSDESVATVTVDTVTTGDPLPQTDFVIEAVAPGSVEITATAGGVSSEPTEVISFPVTFGGAITVDQTGYIDELTIAATANVKFDPDNTEILINDGATYVVSASADQMVVRYLGGASGPATVTLSNLVFLGSTPVAELTASETPDLGGEPNEPANNSIGTAPTINPGDAFMAAVNSSDDASDFFKVTLAADATITVTVGFPADPDIDLEVYDVDGNWLGIYSWYDNPESISEALPAGTYNILVFLYDDHGAPNPVWYDFSITSP
jgi:hypothetical protein